MPCCSKHVLPAASAGPPNTHTAVLLAHVIHFNCKHALSNSCCQKAAIAPGGMLGDLCHALLLLPPCVVPADCGIRSSSSHQAWCQVTLVTCSNATSGLVPCQQLRHPLLPGPVVCVDARLEGALPHHCRLSLLHCPAPAPFIACAGRERGSAGVLGRWCKADANGHMGKICRWVAVRQVCVLKPYKQAPASVAGVPRRCALHLDPHLMAQTGPA
jgi:hypothetical protein